ncbi:hypothetical protein GOP47_0024750 [Adiantum capillus-veneris]|uniref:Tyrosinase copper-binding domain-containing protein n=1 Tax=Adiantum capillus-veneris TaxID=13818 RepID=A0A9D4U3G7_ADICA|nr:hypothetical protein GOP47_0024750 [Adiantum capillus-veneris]
MYRTMIQEAGSQEKFFGKPYRHGDSAYPGPASAEDEPHGTVHEWTGDYTQVGWKDMGALYASGRDPIFYSHHTQIDRMWEVWCSFDGNHNLRDEDFLNTEFVFYDENAELVRVRAGDALDTKALGYVYQDLDLPWKDSVPVRLSRGVATLTPNDTICMLASPIDKPCSVLLQRDPSWPAPNSSTSTTEYLVINGTTWPEGFQSFFTIYLNLPSANNGTTMGCPEYVGCHRAVDQVRLFNFAANTRPSISIDITSRIRDLSLTHQDYVVVTLVPKFGSTNGPSAPATISGSIAIQYR